MRAARAAKLPVLLLHEKNSCEFGTFFQTTPQDLIADGLYKTVALELLPAPHDAVSAVHLARTVDTGDRRDWFKAALKRLAGFTSIGAKGNASKVAPSSPS